MTGRRNLNLPDGWRPGIHSTVQILDSDTLRPDGVHVPGAWRCINPAPDGGWWLQPADLAAVRWEKLHGRTAGASSGMINVHGLRLAPSWLQPAIPGA